MWAVAHSVGGANPAHAKVIAESYKGAPVNASDYFRLVYIQERICDESLVINFHFLVVSGAHSDFCCCFLL